MAFQRVKCPAPQCHEDIAIPSILSTQLPGIVNCTGDCICPEKVLLRLTWEMGKFGVEPVLSMAEFTQAVPLPST